MTLVTGQALLHFAHSQQTVPLHDPTELSDKGDVLRDVAPELSELRVLLDEPLHVGDGLDRSRIRGEGPRLEVFDVGRESRAEVTEVREEILSVERVRPGREDNVLVAKGA